MARPKNEQIGEVACPIKNCEKVCAVFRFRQRTEGRNRFAGKLYCDCPVHGRYGADGKEASQEYILSEGKVWGDAKKPVNPGDVPVVPASATPAPPAAIPAPERPQKSPEPTPVVPAKSPWRPLIS